MWEKWKERTSPSECTFWCSVKAVSLWGKEEGGEGEKVRWGDLGERDGDRWEGESRSWSDPADQMLINWAHCQLWLSSVSVTLLHLTLFFCCSLFLLLHLYSIIFSYCLFSFCLLLTSLSHYYLCLHMISHSFDFPVKKKILHLTSVL